MPKDIRHKIKDLKEQRKAIILAHNYQLPEVQDIADYVGDSLELARRSSNIEGRIILFCGVHFMAETAKILNPDRTVLIPDLHAGCPLADMITPEMLEREKADHPRAAVVCYINSTIEIKAMADICCTSANGVRVTRAVPNDEIIFVPDRYLGSFIARQVKDKYFHLWKGYCPTHMLFTKEKILRLKEENPGAEILAHPECRIEIQEIADAVCSTSQMISHARQSRAKRFIICTEIGMIHRLKKENPAKEFIPGNPDATCPSMKLINLDKVMWALEDTRYEITVAEDIRRKARHAIEKMIQITSN